MMHSRDQEPTSTMSGLFCATLVAIWMLVAAGHSSAQEFEQSDVVVYPSGRTFLARSGFGSVALMPNVNNRSMAELEHEYQTFHESGVYDISTTQLRPQSWFVLNHRSGSGEMSEEYTYLGVLIAKRMTRPQAESLELSRNAGWHPSDTRFADRHASWERFFELQKGSATPEAFQETFGSWHAIPDEASEESSWSDREYWLSHEERIAQCFEAISAQRPESATIRIQARLMRFRVNAGRDPESLVVWYIGLRDSDAVYMKTFSPVGSILDGEYCLALE